MTTTHVAQVAVQVETIGKVPNEMAESAVAKVSSVLRHAAGPVLFARVTLSMSAQAELPAAASVHVDMNGRIVRAQASGESMRGAIGQLASRLKVRLGRAERNWATLRGTMPDNEPGEWRHQSIPAHRPQYFPRPAAELRLVGHYGLVTPPTRTCGPARMASASRPAS